MVKSFEGPPGVVGLVSTYARCHALSTQEAQVLHAAALGLTDKGIAAALGLSRNTIGTYWQRIYAKLHVTGAREILAELIAVSVSRASERSVENGAASKIE